MIRSLTPTFAVAPQLTPDDVRAAAAEGFTTLVNNRPDGEEPDQPTDAALRQAAEAAGMAYLSVPIDPTGPTREKVDAMAAAIEDSPGPVLAFCRSGTRSTFLWALARSQAGEPADTLIERAAAAGYDITPIRPILQRP